MRRQQLSRPDLPPSSSEHSAKHESMLGSRKNSQLIGLHAKLSSSINGSIFPTARCPTPQTNLSVPKCLWIHAQVQGLPPRLQWLRSPLLQATLQWVGACMGWRHFLYLRICLEELAVAVYCFVFGVAEVTLATSCHQGSPCRGVMYKLQVKPWRMLMVAPFPHLLGRSPMIDP